MNLNARIDSGATNGTTSMFTYLPAPGAAAAAAAAMMKTATPTGNLSAVETTNTGEMKDINLLQENSLERYYNTNLLLMSTGEPPSSLQLTPVEPSTTEPESGLMQEEERRKDGGYSRSMHHFHSRSSIAGDLASPQHHMTSSSKSLVSSSQEKLAIKPLHGNCDTIHLPHTPTTPSSAASGSSSDSILLPPRCANILDSTAVFLPQRLSPSSLVATADTDDLSPQSLICQWDNCQHQFTSLASLVTHLYQCHTLSLTQFVCQWEDCPRRLKPFDARYKLITHLRCHTGEKPYRCEVSTCKRSFSRLENLKLHTRTHTGEKPYQCHYGGCTKKFNNTSDRAKHMKTHITRKPYACKYPGCGKCYTDPSSMRKHIKYTHKLKEESERGDSLSLLSPPKRKRNSASSSSSSSCSSSTPHTPQQHAVLLHSPPLTALQDTSSFLQAVPVTSYPPLTVGTSYVNGNTMSSKPQVIPVMKLGGGGNGGGGRVAQPILLPAYQQPPIMMILTHSTSVSNLVTAASTTAPANIQWSTVSSTPAHQATQYHHQEGSTQSFVSATPAHQATQYQHQAGSSNSIVSATPAHHVTQYHHQEGSSNSIVSATSARQVAQHQHHQMESSYSHTSALKKEGANSSEYNTKHSIENNLPYTQVRSEASSSFSTTSRSSSVEEQLRQQIAELQQQLHLSQLAAGHKPHPHSVERHQQPPPSPDNPERNEESSNGSKAQNGSTMQTTPPQLMTNSSLDDRIITRGSSNFSQCDETTQSGTSQPVRQVEQETRGQVLLSNSMPVLNMGTGQTVQLPQFVPIPILQSQASQFLYMSPN